MTKISQKGETEEYFSLFYVPNKLGGKNHEIHFHDFFASACK